jgi:hypothetical protein
MRLTKRQFERMHPLRILVGAGSPGQLQDCASL